LEEALRLKARRERLAQGKELRRTWSDLQKKQTSLLHTKPGDGGMRGLGLIRSEVADELLVIKQQINEITAKIEILEEENDVDMLLEDQSKSKFEYKIRCPSLDCVGFANEMNRCTHCQIFICENCHEKADEGHICDPDTIKNVQLLQQDTKGCPKCNTPIHKIEGCDQMWCPQCKTAFSWNTGKIEKGIIHNPHYYQWQQDQNYAVRNIGDQACGGIPTRQAINAFVYQFSILLRWIEGKTQKETKTKLLVLRSLTLGHFILLNTIQTELDEHRAEIHEREETLRNLRIRVLIGDIKSDYEYKQKHLNTFLHAQAYANEAIPIYEMATACVIERMNEIIGLLSSEYLETLRTPNITRGGLILALVGDLERINAELVSIYEYVAQELVKLTNYYPKKIKNRGKDINSLFEELPRLCEECREAVIHHSEDLHDPWANPITDRFGEV